MNEIQVYSQEKVIIFFFLFFFLQPQIYPFHINLVISLKL